VIKSGGKMKNYMYLPILLIFALTTIQCQKGSEINAPEDGKLLLNYKIMSGWTGKISTITIFWDKSASKNINGAETAIEFTASEKNELDICLSRYSSFEKEYKPLNGGCSDCPYYELVYYKTSPPDTVSILGLLDSVEIPAELVNLITLLMSKL
jgi:hypothetical protein